MQAISRDAIDRVRAATDIVTAIGQHVQLRQAGKDWKGLCPFHEEDTPSFFVVPEKRMFHCFGCDKKGDVYAFFMELEHKPFYEIVVELAARAGIRITPETPAERAARVAEEQRRKDIAKANDLAATFFRECLIDVRIDSGGRDYLDGRGIGVEVAQAFRLGYAPAHRDALATWLHGRVPQKIARDAGLIGGEGEGAWDFFRNRLMCPIIAPDQRVLGFSGRTLSSDPDEVKYKNTVETPIFVKGECVFGLHATKAAVRKAKRYVLVEGNFDVIALHQAGLCETVAPLGTALTPKQAALLRGVPRVVLCLDGDAAGRAATIKSLVALYDAGIDVWVATLPEGEDPDSFVRKYGRQTLDDLLAQAMPAPDHLASTAWLKAREVSPMAALTEIAALLRRMGDVSRRDVLMEPLPLMLGLAPEIVKRAVFERR